MTPDDAERRLGILQCFDNHGLAATGDAFDGSRRTLYRWKAIRKAQDGKPAAFAAKSYAPRKRRALKTDRHLVSEIRRRRTRHPNLGKAKRHVPLAPWCARHGIALPSVSTIGRIIERWYIDPKTPKTNAHGEHFNRSNPESFVDGHEDWLFTELALLNRTLADWLVFYNAERPHHTFGQPSPLSFLLKRQPEWQRYWTHTLP